MNVQRELQVASKCAQTQKEHIPVPVEKDMNLSTPSPVKVRHHIIEIHIFKMIQCPYKHFFTVLNLIIETELRMILKWFQYW